MRTLTSFFAIWIVASDQQYSISAVVGGSPQPTPANAASYFIGGPLGAVSDRNGNIYFASSIGAVFKLNTGGSIQLIAGIGGVGYSGDGGPATLARFSHPLGVALDSSGAVYVADSGNNRIRKIAPDGTISTFAGTGIGGYSGDGGPASAAQFQNPSDLFLDSAGNLFVADEYNHAIRRISPEGTIRTIAGNGTPGFSGDGGPSLKASLNYPSSMFADATGNLYIADYQNSRIRKVTADGTISTVAGNGQKQYLGDATGDLGPYLGDGGAATRAIIDPAGIRADAAGNLLIADQTNSRIRRITSDGIIHTIAGKTSASTFSGDGGPATSAALFAPYSITTDPAGDIYISDLANYRLRKISTGGIISTIAGEGKVNYAGDGGAAAQAILAQSFSVSLDALNQLYIADSGNNRVRKVSRDGTIATLAGGPSAIATSLSAPSGVLATSDGGVFIADTGHSRVIKLLADGTIKAIAGTGTSGYNGDGIPATSAQLMSPYGMSLDPSGNLYIADYLGARVRKVATNGVISTIAGTGTTGFGSDGVPATTSQILYPVGLAFDSTAGALYIGEFGTGVRKVAPDGTITRLINEFTSLDLGDGGPALNANVRFFSGWLALDGNGNIYLSEGAPFDSDSNRIRKISKDGTINTIAGTGNAAYSGDSGPAIRAEMYSPLGLAIDNGGNIYFPEQNPNVIRRLTPVSPLSISTSPRLSAGTIGSVYSATLAASGGFPPYRWKIADGNNIPPGLSLSPAGVISGTPASGGNFTFTVAVSDAAASTASAVLTIAIGSQPAISAIVHAASAKAGSIAPGEIVVIYGDRLGPNALVTASVDDAGYVQTQNNGTSVTFNGFAAPIVFASSAVVAAVAPYEISGPDVQVILEYQGQLSAPFSVSTTAATPAIFTANASGTGQAAAVNLDGSLNDPAHPTPIGNSLIFFVTGEGQTSPAGIDGKPAQVPLPAPLGHVSVTIGGQSAFVQYAGGAPGEVAGLMQVNVVIPSGIQPGNSVPLSIKVGDAQSPEGVTIAISQN